MEDELYHYGVKGMKWGVRKDRYQRSMERQRRQYIADEARDASRNRSSLSEDELDARIRRLRKEDELRRLTEQNYNQGRNAAKGLLEQYGKQIVGASVGAVAGVIAKEVIAPMAQEKIANIKARKNGS